VKESFSLRGTYLATGSLELLTLAIDSHPNENTSVSIELSNTGTIAHWQMDQLVSDVAIRRMAATARDVEHWSALSLPYTCDEWAEGPPPSISLWIDCGGCEFSALSRDRIDFTLHEYRELPVVNQFTLRCAKADIAEWGSKLDEYLRRCNVTLY